MKYQPTIQLTPATIERLKEKRALLKARHLRVSAELRSEDIGVQQELTALRHDEQAMLEREIETLDQLLAHARPLTANPRNHFATLGKHVTYKINGELRDDILVDPIEADPANHRVSVLSPLGLAILGKPSGVQASYHTKHGRQSFEILGIA